MLLDITRHCEFGYNCFICSELLEYWFSPFGDSGTLLLNFYNCLFSFIILYVVSSIMLSLFTFGHSELGAVRVIAGKVQDLMGKRLLFKLKISLGGFFQADPFFFVIAISNNEDLIEMFQLYTGFNKVIYYFL